MRFDCTFHPGPVEIVGYGWPSIRVGSYRSSDGVELTNCDGSNGAEITICNEEGFISKSSNGLGKDD